MEIASVDPEDLRLTYRLLPVLSFVLRNLIVLVVGLPLAALGFVLFALPFYVPRWLASALRPELDVEGTVKFLASLLIAPLWMLLLATAAWFALGTAWAVAVLLGAIPLALFTRYFFEHWRGVMREMRTFLVLGSRTRLKAQLYREGKALAAQVESIADELRPRLAEASSRRQAVVPR